jgi:hypothetical protein
MPQTTAELMQAVYDACLKGCAAAAPAHEPQALQVLTRRDPLAVKFARADFLSCRLTCLSTRE